MSAVLHTDFKAADVDGKVIDQRDVLSVANLPLDRIARFLVDTDSRQVPTVRVGVDPRKGERVNMFTRHAIQAGNGGGKTSVLVIEVAYDEANPSRFVRLYLHPTQGPILSTEDLYF